MLTDEQIERYSRQIILPSVGGRGQEQLLAAAVALIDPRAAHGLCAAYLAAAGIGALRWITAQSIPAVAGEHPDLRIEHDTRHPRGRATEIVERAGVVVDASDDL